MESRIFVVNGYPVKFTKVTAVLPVFGHGRVSGLLISNDKRRPFAKDGVFFGARMPASSDEAFRLLEYPASIHDDFETLGSVRAKDGKEVCV